ncbi:TPA: hypothetical protein ACGORU_001416 [Streptococcus suis]|nr:hypothetical protein [Streptococcus suis]MBY5039425.1 hypothetical protein [Streptococcus suis]HEL1612382.1 hypothetical protein [Streptococcus suis]HEM3576819.1 hypothetical protein [Streptococcus suis]
MNKRVKKKYELENRIRFLETQTDFLIRENIDLRQLVERNALATNRELMRLKSGKKRYFDKFFRKG